MPDETPIDPAPNDRPLEPGDFVTHVGGHPNKGDGPEPVGRVVAVIPQVKIAVDKDGKPKLDKDGVAKVEEDGVSLAVTWPSLRLEGRYKPESLKRREVGP